MKKVFLTISIAFLLVSGISVFGQSLDTRYSSNLNLPFNRKAGDINPQTGNVVLSYTDLELPGRAGFNFSFGRIWSLNQSNAFNMYFDGSNRLNSNTIERVNRLGVGWSSNIPYILENSDTVYSSLNLFFGGSVYEIDRTGIVGGDIPGRSNLLGYDLTDIRIFKDSSLNYSHFINLAPLKARYTTLTDNGGDTSCYTLITKSNERFYFRADGKLMMKQDRSGLNRIWYFYKEGELSVVVDSVGREIRFAYSLEGNLESITWDVTIGKKEPDGARVTVTESRTISYSYLDGETGYPEISAFKSSVINYRRPYVLSTMRDNMGNVTRYDYVAGIATFTYDSSNAHSGNVYLMLKEISQVYRADGKFKNKRCFEYEIPGTGMYTDYFFNGMREYYRISRQYMVNKNSRIMNDAYYRYFDKGYNGNYSSYSTEITMDRVKTIYKYTLSDSSSTNHVLDTLTVISDDGSFIEHKDFIYAPDRTILREDTFRLGRLIYSDSFQYDNKGNLIRHIDRLGLVTTTTYDDKYSIPLNQIVKVTVNGLKESYRSENIVNTMGQIERKVIYLKDGGGKLRAVNLAHFKYDAYGNMVSSTDAAGNTTHTVYDEENKTFPIKVYQDVTISNWETGNVHSSWQKEPVGDKKVRIRSWKVFNSDGSIWLEIDNEGYAIEYFYDRNGQEIERVNPDGDDVKGFAQPLSYDKDTGILKGNDFDDFRANPDFVNFLLKRANNPGLRLEIDYGQDYVKSFTDIDRDAGQVKVTAKEGDGLGNIIREIEYKGALSYAIKMMDYDSYGRMVVLTDADSDLTSGTPITVNGETYIRFDKSWVVKYDVLGRKVRVLYPITRGKFDTKDIVYDDISNKVTTTDAEGITLEESYDWNGNLIKVVRYGKNGYTPADKIETYSFEYDELNRKVKFTDAMGLDTKYIYDERSLLVEQSYVGSGSDYMSYDDRGLLVSKTDRNGNRIDFSYDELGRNLESNHFVGGLPSYTTSLVYDNRGNAVRISNGTLIEHFEYDYANRVVRLDRKLVDTNIISEFRNSVWSHSGANDIFTFRYNYNDGGMVREMLYPDGSIHKYDYDSELFRLQRIHEALDETTMSSQLNTPEYKPFVNSFNYSKSGLVTAMSYQNGTGQSWEFDNRKRISRISIAGVDKNIADLNFTLNSNGDIERINNHEYLYDGFNRIIYSKTQTPTSRDRQQLVAKHFGTYKNGSEVNGALYNSEADIDNDGRVSGVDHILASFDRVEKLYDVERFKYDKNGNRTTLVQNGDIYSYEYGARNRLERIYIMSEGEHTKRKFAEYLYDNNGNTIKRTLYTKEGPRIVEFKYDTMNRVVKTIENGSNTTIYTYDNGGNRLTKQTSSSITLYLRHGQIAVAMDIEINLATDVADVGKINRYILSGDLLSGRVTKAFTRDGVTGTISNSVFRKSWYHLDHLNSTKAVTNESGILEVLYEYRAFGEQLKRVDVSGNDIDDRAKYSYGGKELDGETELYYFNARYYDAFTGRFINVDPVQDGTNWYIYCNNNPLNRVDPTGLTDENNNLKWEPGQRIDNYKNGKGFRTNRQIDRYEKSEAGEFTRTAIDELKGTDWGKSITGEKIISALEDAYNKGRIHLSLHPNPKRGGIQIGMGNTAHMWINKDDVRTYMDKKNLRAKNFGEATLYKKFALITLAHEGSHYAHAKDGHKVGNGYEIEAYRISNFLAQEYCKSDKVVIRPGYFTNNEVQVIYDKLKDSSYSWMQDNHKSFPYYNKGNIGY